MGINFNTNLFQIGFKPKVQLNNQRNIYFGNVQTKDTFENNSVERFFNEAYIKKAIEQNPEILNILKSNSIPLNININALNDLKTNHCKITQELCAQITKNLPRSIKDHVNLKDLKDGAMLHDIGKVLIPEEILNKSDTLSPSEYEIMNLHSQLGYELLKNSGLNDNVLNMIRYHHTGSIANLYLQIVSLADKYSALTEKRPYKDAFEPKKALYILHKEVQAGKIHPFVFNALVKSVNNTEKNNKINIS